MSAIYKVKFTRKSNLDKWPIEYFSERLSAEFLSMANDVLYQPVAGIQHYYSGVLPISPGYLDCTYEEYDPTLDLDESILDQMETIENFNAFGIRTFYVSDDDKFVRIVNPSALTHTMHFTFNNWENLQLFLSKCTWEQGPSKSEFNDYINSVGQTITETFIDNGVETTSPILLFS